MYIPSIITALEIFLVSVLFAWVHYVITFLIIPVFFIIAMTAVNIEVFMKMFNFNLPLIGIGLIDFDNLYTPLGIPSAEYYLLIQHIGMGIFVGLEFLDSMIDIIISLKKRCNEEKPIEQESKENIEEPKESNVELTQI